MRGSMTTSRCNCCWALERVNELHRLCMWWRLFCFCKCVNLSSSWSIAHLEHQGCLLHSAGQDMCSSSWYAQCPQEWSFCMLAVEVWSVKLWAADAQQVTVVWHQNAMHHHLLKDRSSVIVVSYSQRQLGTVSKETLWVTQCGTTTRRVRLSAKFQC